MPSEGEAQKQKLLQAGYPASEVASWEAEERSKLTAGGFKPAEVDDYFGVKPTDFTTFDQSVDAAYAPGSKVAGNPWENFMAGVGMGSSTLPFHRPNMIQPKDAGLFQSIMYGLGQTVSDLPVALFGATAGAAATIETGPFALAGAGAGGFALPTLVRESALDLYRHGGVSDWKDVFSRVSQVAFKTEKAALTGAVAGPIAGAVGGAVGSATGSKAAEVASNAVTFGMTATAVGSMLDGHIPSANDFVTATVLALGPAVAIHYVGAMPQFTEQGKAVKANLEDIWSKTGLTPEEVLQKAKEDPAVQAEIIAPRAVDGSFTIPNLEEFAASLNREDKVEPPQPVEKPVSETVTLYRGVKAGREPFGSDTIAPGAFYMTPVKGLAESHARLFSITPEGVVPNPNAGTVAEHEVHFNNLLKASDIMDAKAKLGLPRSAYAADIAKAAQAQGYDGVTFKSSSSGQEYMVLKDPRAPDEGPKAPFVTPETVPDVHLELFRTLEGSADDAVSPAGAIGRYQIMPNTARQYGFDPAHLQDPAYNEQVARAIIADLNNKFDGNFADMAVAYNAGPGRARAWIKGGRKFETLPLETQKYLLHAEELGAITGDTYATIDMKNQLEFQGQDTGWVPEIGGGNGGGKEPPLEGEIFAPEPSPKRIEGHVMTTDEAADAVRDIVAPELKKTWRDWLDPLKQLVRAIDTTLSPARRLDRKVGTDDKDTSIEDHLRQTFGSFGRADAFIREGVVDLSFDPYGNPVWKQTNRASWVSAFKAVKKAGGNAKDFLAYRLAARAVEKHGQGVDTGIDINAARMVLADPKWKARYGEGLDILRQNDRAALEYARRSGLYSDKAVESIGALNDFYISLNRVMDENYNPANIPGRGFRPRKPIKEMSGSKRLVIDPESATIDNRMTLIAMADRNIALQRLIDIATDYANRTGKNDIGFELDEALTDVAVRDLKTGKLLEAELLDENGQPISAGDKANLTPFLVQRQLAGRLTPDHFIVFRDGKPEVWKATDQSTADMIRMALPGKADFVTQLFQKFADIQRAGIATDLGFALRTLGYGQWTNAAFAKGGSLVPYSDFVRSAMDAWFNNGKMWEEWRANGGAGAALADIDHRYIKLEADRIFTEAGAWDKVVNFSKHPIDAFRQSVSAAHAAAQVGYYIHARNKGVPAPKAAMASRAAYLDSAEHAANQTLQRLTTVAPFLGTSFLDLHQVAAAGRDRPLALAAKATTVLTLTTVLNILANVALDNANNVPEKDRYFNRPRWVRDLYWSLPPVNGASFQMKVPPSTGTFIFKVLPERFMEYLFTHNRSAFDGMMGTFMSMMSPIPFPSAVTPLIENTTNFSFQTGRPVVPASLSGNSPWMQYGPNTTETAKALARLIGPGHPPPAVGSPYMIENWVKGWTGTVPLSALRQLEAAFNPIKKADDIANLPFLGQFFVRNFGAGQALDDFYSRYDAVATAHSDLALAIRRNNPDEIRANLKAQAFLKVGSFRSAITNVTAVIRAIDQDPKMTGDEKRRQIDALSGWMYLTAKYGLQIMDTIE